MDWTCSPRNSAGGRPGQPARVRIAQVPFLQGAGPEQHDADCALKCTYRNRMPFPPEGCTYLTLLCRMAKACKILQTGSQAKGLKRLTGMSKGFEVAHVMGTCQYSKSLEPRSQNTHMGPWLCWAHANHMLHFFRTIGASETLLAHPFGNGSFNCTPEIKSPRSGRRCPCAERETSQMNAERCDNKGALCLTLPPAGFVSLHSPRLKEDV